MKLLQFLLLALLFQGCLYFNDRGVSSHLYDNCHSYYDIDGNFIQECDENLIDYKEMKEGVVAIKDEIKENIEELTTQSSTTTQGVSVEQLTPTELQELQQTNPTLREEIEPNRYPCQ